MALTSCKEQLSDGYHLMWRFAPLYIRLMLRCLLWFLPAIFVFALFAIFNTRVGIGVDGSFYLFLSVVNYVLMVLGFVCMIVAMIKGMQFYASVFKAVEAAHKAGDKKVSSKEVWASSKGYFWRLGFVYLLFSLCIMAGILAFVVPAVILGIWFCFAYFFAVLRDKPVIESFKYSKGIAKGNFWYIFWRWIVVFLVSLAAVIVITLPQPMLDNPDLPLLIVILYMILAFAVEVLLTSFTFSFWYIFFLDLEKELPKSS
ncbi:hypothetical protein HOG48_06455 [Candidatus Peregrinibacteria bacterium]|jgi:hypothetical protein|nr:hypothetical protein [Candidatus Peregrinibacteria bacterium]